MSVSTSTNRFSYTGNASQVDFPFPALFYDNTHLAVYLDGVLQSTGYTITGATDPAGGTVTFSVAPGTGVIVNLLRVVPVTQQVTLAVAGAFPAKTVEKALDLAVMANQQFDEILDRAITLPVESTLTAADIPDPGDPANYGKGLKIAGDGSGIDVFDISTTPFSSVITTKGDIAIFGASAVDRLPVGPDTSILVADSTQARGLAYKTLSPLAGAVHSPIINGNMEIWQRGSTFAAAANGAYTADRWSWNTGGGAGVATINRSTSVPSVAQAGVLFNYSLEVDVTTADATLAGSDNYAIRHKIEGYNWRHFAQRSFTLSFWIYSTKTGTHSVAFVNTGFDESYVAEYTVNASNTWEYKTVTVTASPSVGTWDYTNGIGLIIAWPIGLVSSLATSTIGSWIAGSAFGSTAQVNVMDNTANFFRLTGVRLELGSVATPIQFKSFQDELTQCQRYYWKTFPYAITPANGTDQYNSALKYSALLAGINTFSMNVRFPTRLRTDPTMTFYNVATGGASGKWRNFNDSGDSGTPSQLGTAGDTGFTVTNPQVATDGVGEQLVLHATADAEL